MARKRSSGASTVPLFRPDQTDLFEESYEERLDRAETPVECLGRTFPSEAARRTHYLGRLREFLLDPAFRGREGFPVGRDEDILRLSDPPWYTACPNPFLAEIVAHHGQAFDPVEPYHREPFTLDISAAKTDGLYKAHGYHTKVPHLAIVPSILHYTRPGDLVLDGFCGSGMTGVAAAWCGVAPEGYRKALAAEWERDGRDAPEWGARRVVLNDLSPAATVIAAGYTQPFDVPAFAARARRLLAEVEEELGWMYETRLPDGTTGRINFTVWSEVFSCPQCGGEIEFLEEALDDNQRVRAEFPCPHCDVALNKDRLERLFDTLADPASGQPWRRIRLRPALINYTAGGSDGTKRVDDADRALIERIAALPLPVEVPADRFPIEAMYHGSRLAPKGFTHVHHFFLPRAAQALAAAWRRARAEADPDLRRALLFFVEQAIWGMSVLNRYSPSHFSQVNRALSGVYYVASQHSEVSPWYILDGKLERLVSAFKGFRPDRGTVTVTTGSCDATGIPENTVDYIFTDPPFGENIFYADLNFLVESWHGVRTETGPEAIVDQPKRKGLHEYQGLMTRCFAEYYRVLKPGRWITVVFHNSSNAVWNALQEAMGTAGFIIASVGALDKQQGSYRQVTSMAVKQDLVISAFKPSEDVAGHAALSEGSAEGVWRWVREYLGNQPPVLVRDGAVQINVERTGQRLFDRMVAFHVRHRISLPMPVAEFLAGLAGRFTERDRQYFLAEQVAAYDRRRAAAGGVRQYELLVTDEGSAIQWLRQQLETRPQSFQDMQPVFMRESQNAWARHERPIELRDLLRRNFLLYQGGEPVPATMQAALSAIDPELATLPREHPRLMARALNCWYVPNPDEQGDLERLREQELLREFQDYRAARGRLKQFRTEAVRAGFKAAFSARDYQAILDVAAKLPEAVLQEDDKLLMFYDAASTRVDG